MVETTVLRRSEARQIVYRALAQARRERDADPADEDRVAIQRIRMNVCKGILTRLDELPTFAVSLASDAPHAR